MSGTSGAIAVTFSPDGQWLAFFADGKLKKVPLRGGSPVTLGDTASMGVPALAWLDDGNIAFNNRNYDLQLVSEDGGIQRRICSADSSQRGIVTVTALPGGRGVLVGVCTVGCPEVDVRVVETGRGEAKVLADGVLKGWYTNSGHVVFVRPDGGVFAAPLDLRKLEFRSLAWECRAALCSASRPIVSRVRRTGADS